MKNKQEQIQEQIDLLREKQTYCRGASDWAMYEEEIQELLNDIELRNCFDEEE